MTETPSNIRLLPNLLSISKSLRALMGLKLAELGLHPGQDELLLALSPNMGTGVSVLANRLGVRPSTVSKMVDLLVQAGQVERAVNPRDARRTVICITPSGIEMQGRIIEVWLRLESEFL
ncbi:MarR family transcriptional regulator [Aurantimonas endophytica]|uniref:DNA-binding MarR family transcriptional regulator n=1 Tax=Aurantimonas endophytica TaxID=1522175 RepID=A0A7W6HAR7_9HYPH|nr:DNA-binding MarR family transcriptional regulator [Aurantimonas endophytica]MCO6402742.1 MarR family transcriptional regulator [Aurantimonas endophytica]